MTVANEALIRRAVQGSVFYPMLLTVLIAATEWHARHRGVAAGFWAATTITGAIRLVYLKRLLARPASYTDRHPRGLTAVLLGPALGFGAFTAASVALFGLDSLAGLMALLVMLGFAAGGTSSLAMSRRAHVAFLLTLLLPLAVTAAQAATREGLTVAMLLAFNLLFLIREGQAANRAFVALFDNGFALEQAVASLEAQRAQLVAANAGMRLVLDCIAQGLCVVDRAGRIDGRPSRAFEAWFGATAPGDAFGARVGGGDFAARFELGLEALIEDVLPAELALAQLPSSLTRAGRALDLAYTAIERDGAVTGLLVVINDITDHLAAEAAERDQRELVRLAQLRVRDPDGLVLFCTGGDELVEQLRRAPSPPDQRHALHTLKGNAAVMGLDALADLCHDLEDELAQTDGGLAPAQLARLGAAWTATVARVRSIMGDGGPVIALSVAEHDQVLRMIEDRVPHEVLAAVARDWRLESVPRRFERMATQATLLARKLGRDVAVEVDVPPLRLDAHQWQEFWMACVHLMRNSVDHGIEDRSTRTARNKRATGKLVLSARCDRCELVVRVRDDGRGIDWAKVQAKARALGLPGETPQDLRAALFADGVSTRDQVTEVSGRGVGLGAVVEQTQRLGGIIEVESEIDRGTEITIRVPCLTPQPPATSPIAPA